MIILYFVLLALPYGAYTLEHMINASLIVSPNNRNIFLATDDDVWLQEATTEYIQRPNNLISKLNLNLYTFHARHGHRSKVTMDVAAEFFATMEIGQQCEAYVGYRSCSAVASLFYQAMCYYTKKNGYLNCPPLYDICKTAI